MHVLFVPSYYFVSCFCTFVLGMVFISFLVRDHLTQLGLRAAAVSSILGVVGSKGLHKGYLRSPRTCHHPHGSYSMDARL